MKKIIFLLLVGAKVGAQAEPPPAIVSTATVHASSGSVVRPFVLRPIVNTAFSAGEVLRFVIQYEFVSAGTAVMGVSAGPLIDGRPTLHIETKAESTKFVDTFFKVRDFNSAIIDQDSLFSRNFHQNLKEGGYTVIRNTSFDYDRHIYTFERTRHGNTKKHDGPLTAPVMDVLGAFFYARTLDLRPGDEISIAVFSDEDMYPLSIKIGRDLETITVPAGKFQCLKIEPLTMGDAIFKASDGRMQIWLTNDEFKMPVLIRSKVFIGSFDAELESFERPPKARFDTTDAK